LSISSVCSASSCNFEIFSLMSLLASAILDLNSAVLALNSSWERDSKAFSNVFIFSTNGVMAFMSCLDLSPTNILRTVFKKLMCYIVFILEPMVQRFLFYLNGMAKLASKDTVCWFYFLNLEHKKSL